MRRFATAALLLLPAALGQDFEHRGFLDSQAFLFPQQAADDRAYVVAEGLFRYEASVEFAKAVRIAGAFDARTDSHHQVERTARLDWKDRGLLRPAFSVRRLSLALFKGGFTLELGKQFIRWGRADILNPTDRFAPKDFLNVANSDFLGVSAARLSYERGSESIDLVWAPQFTPSRIPLLNQRWAVAPEGAAGVAVNDAGSRFPSRSQMGARWSHSGSSLEWSLVFYDGHNHLPLLETQFLPATSTVDFQRFYPQLRLYGGDVAIPLRWVTLKGEAAYYTSRTAEAEEYAIYVVQLERQAGDWSLVGGYAGEEVTRSTGTADFSPDRGLARAFLGRAGYTFGPRANLAVEAVVRQNGEGVWVTFEYSRLLSRHWRVTASYTHIDGDATDFIGQYHRNSHAILALRYSF